MKNTTRNHGFMIHYGGKLVESLTTYHNHWKESWGEFVASLKTTAQVINRVNEEQDFVSYQAHANYCYARAEKAAARYEKIRASKRDNFQMRALVEAANSCVTWHEAGDFFSNEAATDRTEAGLMDLHENPYTTGYYGER